jgi:hypothetical protein
LAAWAENATDTSKTAVVPGIKKSESDLHFFIASVRLQIVLGSRLVFFA